MGDEKLSSIPIPTNKGLSVSQLRVDLGRDTSIHVCRNIDGHIYLTLGRCREATLILHPHAAQRLIANIGDVLNGKEWAAA